MLSIMLIQQKLPRNNLIPRLRQISQFSLAEKFLADDCSGSAGLEGAGSVGVWVGGVCGSVGPWGVPQTYRPTDPRTHRASTTLAVRPAASFQA